MRLEPSYAKQMAFFNGLSREMLDDSPETTGFVMNIVKYVRRSQQAIRLIQLSTKLC